MSGIDCRQAETLVARYIKHTLSTDELEEFLDHIEHCSSCYDELETYFIVHEAIQQLDEKEDGTVLDFRKLLKQDIRRSRRIIRQRKAIKAVTGILVIGALVILAAFFYIGYWELTLFLNCNRRMLS